MKRETCTSPSSLPPNTSNPPPLTPRSPGRGGGGGGSVCLFKTVRLQGADGICFQSLFFVWLHKRGSLSLLNLPPPFVLGWSWVQGECSWGRSEEGKEPYWEGVEQIYCKSKLEFSRPLCTGKGGSQGLILLWMQPPTALHKCNLKPSLS